MTLEKHALYSGERDGERLVQLVRPGELVKTASAMLPAVQDFIGSLSPDPRYTYVLVNAMSFSEYFGPNSNADWYGYNPHLDFNGLTYAPADFGKNIEVDRENGKTWPYGFPCFYNATAFAHHKNTDPVSLGFGQVAFVALNPQMKRIELVLRIDNAEAVKKGHGHFLDRLRNGSRVDVSMGAKVPFDLCVCHTDWDAVKRAWKTFDPARHAHPGIAILESHRRSPISGLSVTRSDYCESMRSMRNAVMDDGTKIFVYNDFPRFFDISLVWVGADRTARAMWHLGGTVDTTDDSASQFGAVTKTSSADMTKTASLDVAAPRKVAAEIKRSEIEKEIPDGVAGVVQQAADAEPAIPSDLLQHISRIYGNKTLLSTLASLGIVLRPEEFVSATAENDPVRGRLADQMSQSGVTLDTTGSKISSAFAVSGDAVDPHLAALLQPFAESRSSFAPYLMDRLRAVQCGDKTASRTTLRVMSGGSFDKLASEYLGYRISVLEQAPQVFSRFDIPAAKLSITKLANAPDEAALLLGLGPMVHLLSSHLQQRKDSGEDLSTVGNFVAENPNFSSAATIGAGLRAVMEISAAGGVGNAVKKLVMALKEL